MFSVIQAALVQLVRNTRVLKFPRLGEKRLPAHEYKPQALGACGTAAVAEPARLRSVPRRCRGFPAADGPGQPGRALRAACARLTRSPRRARSRPGTASGCARARERARAAAAASGGNSPECETVALGPARGSDSRLHPAPAAPPEPAPPQPLPRG